jgi:hypothetical protein
VAQLDTTNTFLSGDVVDAASLNNIVDQATALKGIITDQTPIGAPVDPATDLVLVYDASATALRKALVQALPSGVTTVDATATPTSIFNINVTTPSTTPVIALSMDVQAANKILAGPASGSATTPSFRAVVPADLSIPAVVIAAFDIDTTLGNVFSKVLPDNATRTFHLQNGTSGQIIKVYVQQSGTGGTAVVHWTADSGSLRWPGGTEPVMTTGPSHVDLFTFVCMSGNNWLGTVDQDFLL